VGVHAQLQGASPSDDELDEIIVSRIIRYIRGMSPEKRSRISELVILRLKAASKGNSVLLYFHCLTFEELQRLTGLTATGNLKRIVEEVFTQLLSSEKTIVVSLTWSEGDFERSTSYFIGEC